MEKIREVINKRIQEKKKNEFTDLAPIDDIENGAEYLKALHWAIKKKKVKNIALAGPYGAGKSSIIDTYLKKHRIIRSKHLELFSRMLLLKMFRRKFCDMFLKIGAMS